MSSDDNKISRIGKPINLNIGLIFFFVILVYLIISVVMYFTSKHIIGYQVKTGSLSVSNIYEGIALRDETVVTAGCAGYVNYFATEGEKVGTGNLVCGIDETGALQDYINQNMDAGTDVLSDRDLSSLKNEMINFSSSFNEKDFSSVYEFKYAIQGDVLKFSNRNLLSSIDDLRSQSALIKLCNSPASGVVVYSVDGFESKQPVNADKSWFDKEIYEENKKQLINNNIVSIGDPLFKLSDSENWSILIEVDENRAAELVEEKYVKVKFLKNQYESWAKVTEIEGSDDGHYILLSFTNSMITFVMDRFINIELLLDTETGLKVPNTAICDKAFFIVPMDYITKGGDGADGILRETYNEEGRMIPEFIPVTIYNIDEENNAYLDDSILRLGDRIDMPDSAQTFVISKSGTLTGVYNINKGYADFKEIEILNSNEEYSIIRSNTTYGLVAYDYIVLDADSVETDEFIYE
ncbi:MAG: hypothetical protein ILN61_11170 [Lachnospiraceae bacterium]|nr:hypothetical protein [Lachnospiraceae bacterium]